MGQWDEAEVVREPFAHLPFAFNSYSTTLSLWFLDPDQKPQVAHFPLAVFDIAVGIIISLILKKWY